MSSYCECHTNIECEWCRITEQNKRYHKALEFYADESNYVHREDDESVVDIDGGHRASQVLRGDDYWREEL